MNGQKMPPTTISAARPKSPFSTPLIDMLPGRHFPLENHFQTPLSTSWTTTRISSLLGPKAPCGSVAPVLPADTSTYHSSLQPDISSISSETMGQFSSKHFSLHCLHPHRSKMFNTGDIVSWREDGSLDTFGRMDDQVKIKVNNPPHLSMSSLTVFRGSELSWMVLLQSSRYIQS